MEIEFTAVDEFCRLCLKPNAPYLSMFENRTAEMFESLTSIRVSRDDPGSNVTCFTCFVELRSAYETQQKLIDTEILLQEKVLGDTTVKKGPNRSENIERTIATGSELDEQAFQETCSLDDQNPTVFSCSSCLMEFKSTTVYNQHLKIHEKKVCLLCPNMIPADKLKEHHRSHDCGFCEYCGKQLKNAGSLRHHVNLCHREPTITCEECGDVLYNKKEFDLHIRRMHTNNPGFICDHCGAKFFGVGQLNRHIKEKHSDEKPFSCTDCSETFVTKWKLKMHEMSKHSNVLPFACEFCGKGFKFKSSMNLHKKSTHGWKPEEKFHCRSCNNWFPTRQSLSVHTTKMHNK